jgi:hypothetical protein
VVGGLGLMGEHEKLEKENMALKEKIYDVDNPRRRKSDNWMYSWGPKIAELLAAICIFYGGFRVTISTMKDDVACLKSAKETHALKINTLETKFDDIKEDLKEIKQILRGTR